ncbi:MULTISPECIES: sodium-dependent bicarbonate transport family permease [Halomonadaceae]|uniref:sodium-dependent bicarbonate transport family permease n=1 Tax=Halomonadaceae TaxID=28256 RepID=UPI000346F66D|nr:MULTISPECIES: sodium-dependent bicarbonate transport family permease [Halomonas]NAO96541.1 sodium-dependent bicarbonate transport family permease [Halomonas sp. MG34]QGQ69743.1 sodium-dependent bicarbonate transport family permease [Halomonas sp. PA16-9]KIN16140.1 permease [Halomonas sp. KHS3]MCD1586243.1 sodium-dependent bicarbonate transport family permease [Halomonas sp. IOP_14]MCE7516748.1 sodium-dependent bicarbonate transport family permease [Halomonas titanicae]
MPDIVVMFFVLGVVAGVVRSDLSIPKAAYDILSLLLMLTIGLKGGMALHGSLSISLLVELSGVTLLGIIIPLLIFPVVHYLVRLSIADSASLAAHYGSVSAGTFAVALAYTEAHSLITGGQVTLYLVLLELPAIMLGLLLYRRFSRKKAADTTSEPIKTSGLWHETLTNRGVILLVGGVLIGWLYGPNAGESVTGLYTKAFHGILALFLLEMGLVAAETLRSLRWGHSRLIIFALAAPIVLSCFGLLMAYWLGLPAGSAVILASLSASASYIAAPVAIRAAIPDANIGLAMLASLGLTFPFNVLMGIPLYHQLWAWLVG